jgi:TRAP-type mannitol/chloroaromatic compound transport system permease small subunit
VGLLHFIAAFVRAVSALNRLVGRVFSWLALAIVVVCFTVVVQRYVFHVSVLWLQDLYVWLNGAMFTAIAGYALLRDDHVRVDIYYRASSRRWQATADLIGVLIFLLPFMAIVFIYGWPYVTRSWRIGEGSANIGGMPGLFVLKTFIFDFATLVTLQGLAMAGRAILVLAGREDLLPQRLRYKEETEVEAHGTTGVV